MKRRFPIYSFIVFAICIAIFVINWRLWLGDVVERRGRETFYHFVEKNESLDEIAEEYTVAGDKIIEVNSLPSHDSLYTGRALLIPKSAETDPATLDLLEEFCGFPKGVREKRWTHIVVHHSAFGSGNAADFHEMHLDENGWKNGLGYDFVIGNGRGSVDGGIEVGHRWARQMQGSHAKGPMNETGIGICLVGNFEKTEPTEKQMRKLLGLVRFMQRRYGIPRENVIGHKEVPGAQTLCPGKNFDMDTLREDL